ncbi:phage tail tape measure protein [Pseudomonas sp. PDM13]|uniref:phage tail tape measure protein n=1 Tax=Pseudomonas sp. PDM13 TaxID=2769255 RepID=UPI0021DF710C|nr:phage tail tape measure protein [Pseudomonas sp. PDM13]MCU9949858.1 phage tail tape measure protein [Pseudomonas sp. PDM13]
MTTPSLASLGIRVDSADAAEAAENLDRLTTAGAGAEQATKRVGESAEAAAARIKAMVAASLESSDYAKTLSTNLEAAAGSMARVSKESTDWARFQGEMVNRGRALAMSEERVAAQTAKASGAFTDQAADLQKLLGQIDPTVAAYGRLDDMQERLGRFKAAGVLSPAEFADYSARIDQSRAALGQFDDKLAKTGMTAKATAAALRNVPAQLTDIVVSLQAGQSPLTVFLQQGGQLKDMFGGIGPAARALGGYILGLVNPYTLAAAAVGALAVAYYQGSEEQDKFRISLESTGNAAGTTVDQLASMAQRVGDTIGTTGKAAKVLAELAGTGKVTSDALEMAATSAIAWERAGVQAASVTIAEFAKLGEDPVKGVVTLNEKYNFLTASVFEQVRALQEEGDTIGASRVAWHALSDTIDERSERIKQNLGVIERSWQGVTDAAKSALDVMFDIGREVPYDDRIADVDRRIAQAQQGGFGLFSNREESLNRLREQRDDLVSRRDAEKEIAALDGYWKGIDREGNKAYENIQKSLDSTASKQQKLQKALLDSQREINKARAAGYKITADEEAALEKQLREKYKERTPRTRSVRKDAGDARVSAIARENAALTEQLSSTEKLSTAERALAKFNQEVADLKERHILTAQQKQVLASEDEIRAEIQKQVVLQEQLRLRSEAIKLASYQASLDAQQSQAQDGMRLQLAGIGMGDQARQRAQETLRIQQDFEQQSRRLQEQFNQGQISQGLYDQETEALRSALDQRLAMQEDYYEKLDAAQGDWTNGVRAGFETYMESARDAASQAKSFVTSSFNNMEDAITQFVVTGKMSFADFTKSVLADLARIAARQAVTGIFSSIASSAIGSMVGGYFSGGAAAGSTSAGATTSGYTGSSFDSWVAGQRAGGGDVSPNSLYEVNELGPELLNQNGKTYLMTGEQGGSITPLGRGGAAAAAAAGGVNVTVNAPVTVVTQDRTAQGGELDQQALANNLQNQFKSVAEKVVADSWRPGGTSWRNASGRA